MATCGTVGLQRIFAMLADDEVRHYHAIEQMRGRIGAVQLGETVILENVKNIFVEMKEEKPDLYIDSTAETTAYRKACDKKRIAENSISKMPIRSRTGRQKCSF